MIFTIPLVEVFKTSIANQEQGECFMHQLLKQNPALRIDIDLEDRDNILRIEYEGELDRQAITEIATRLGIWIEVLES